MADHARAIHVHQCDALPAFTVWMHGLPLRDGPSALAAVAAAPLPPVGFSAFTQRVRPGAHRKQVQRTARGERTQRINLHIVI